jgi:RecB family exonuclease
MELSNTRVETYLDCPQRYKFRYLDRIHEEPRVELEFGKLIHEVLQFLHHPKNTSQPTVDDLNSRYEKGWANLPELEGLQHYKPLGLTMLRNYHSAHLPLKEKILAVEQRFRLPLDDHALVGAMDRVGQDEDGNILITDYKTSKTLPTQPDVDRNKQVIIYHHSARELYPGRPVTVRLHFLRFDFLFESVPTEEAWIEVKSEMLRAAYGIQSGHFTPKPGWICEYCDYTTLCPAMRHLFEPKPEEAELFDGIDIEQAVREYVELKEGMKTSRLKTDELSSKIRSYLDAKGYTRLFVDDIVLSLVRSERRDWDEERLARVLAKLDLLQETLGIKMDRLKKLIESKGVAPEQKREIESCGDSRIIDTLRYRFRDEDVD